MQTRFAYVLRVTLLHRSSSGHVLSAPAWLDAHFEACRAEYQYMLDYAALPADGRVLDAGCGSGSFLPFLCDGGRREVWALDAAVRNIEHVAGVSGPQVRPLAGSVCSLPIAGDAFDAVWCANTTQYLDNDDLRACLHEFVRVVRPGGIVAIKDVDMTAFRFSPGPPLLAAHLAEACLSAARVTPESRGSVRGRELRLWLAEAGLVDVRQKSFVIERSVPLDDASQRFWSEWLPYLAQLAEQHGVPDEDLAVWGRVATPEDALCFVQDPAFYASELQLVATGRVSAVSRC